MSTKSDKNPSLDQQIEELERLILELEATSSIDEAIEGYKRATELSKRVSSRLKKTKLKIDTITTNTPQES